MKPLSVWLLPFQGTICTWVVLVLTVLVLLQPTYSRGEARSCIRSDKFSSYISLPSSEFYTRSLNTALPESLCALTSPWDSGCDGCVVYLITGQHLASWSCGRRRETGHETKELFRSYIVFVSCDFFNF